MVSRLALFGLPVLALLAAGCAPELSADSVARVGDQVVSEKDLAPYQEASLAAITWVKTPTGRWVKARPEGPDYRSCIAAKKQTLREIPMSQQSREGSESDDPLASGNPSNEDEALRASCKSDADSARSLAIQQLLSATWINQAADRLGVVVSDEEVRESRDQQLQTLSSQSGMTVKQLLARSQVSLEVLNLSVSNSILFERVRERLSQASEDELRNYYQKNRDAFDGLGYEQVKETISTTLSNKIPDDIAAEKLQAATVCGDNFKVLICGNANKENNAPIELVTTPSLNQMLYPQVNSAIVDIPGPNGAIVGDDPASAGDGGAVYGDVTEFTPRTEKELVEIIEKGVRDKPHSEGDGS